MTTFPPTAMSLQLHPDDLDFKVFCGDERRGVFTTTVRKWFRTRQVRRTFVVATCTRELGHEPDWHIDTHEGKRWAA